MVTFIFEFVTSLYGIKHTMRSVAFVYRKVSLRNSQVVTYFENHFLDSYREQTKTYTLLNIGKVLHVFKRLPIFHEVTSTATVKLTRPIVYL